MSTEGLQELLGFTQVLSENERSKVVVSSRRREPLGGGLHYLKKFVFFTKHVKNDRSMQDYDVRHHTCDSLKFGNLTACVFWCLWHFAASTCRDFFLFEFTLPIIATASPS
eukprot:g75398.t1